MHMYSTPPPLFFGDVGGVWGSSTISSKTKLIQTSRNSNYKIKYVCLCITIRLFVLQHYVTIQDKPEMQKDPFISDL